MVLLFAFCGWLFYNASHKDDKKDDENVSLNSDKPKEYSYDDVLKERENNNSNMTASVGSTNVEAPTQDLAGTADISSQTNSTPDNSDYYKGREEENIRRIQAQIRSNNISSDDGDSYASYPVPTPTRHTKKKIKTKDAVTASSNPATAEKKHEIKNSRFFSAGNNRMIAGNSIRATVHGDQTVMDGSTLKMRLLEDAEVDGVVVPRNTFIYGTVKINNERVEVKITSVRLKNNLFKFEKEIFDRDAIKGIYVPGNIKSEARSEATDQGLNQINSNVDGIVGTGVNAVVTAGKSVLSRNIKRTKITIKTNYEIYLQ